ncbi:MAG: TonB family protein [Candidatus Dadabacteria bacterium]|nr:MAG: TonB family protein [Candidatus Dadabacteria bacterium]
MSELHSKKRFQDLYAEKFKIGVLLSTLLHISVALYILHQTGNFRKFAPPIVYSVTLEGGKKLGGISQAPKTKKIIKAPPKKAKEPVQSRPQGKAKDAEVSLKSKVKPKKTPQPKTTVKAKKPLLKKPVKKPVAKKVTKKKRPYPLEDLDKRLQEAIQRYTGESANAGGRGFGAARLGGRSMGGGEVRPPEFFAYKRLLENHIKAGWRWFDTSAALIAQVEFSISRDGQISDLRIISSSGNSNFDQSVLRAINKANPVPPPPEKVYKYFALVRMTFDPRDQ